MAREVYEEHPEEDTVADVPAPARCAYCGGNELRHLEKVEVVRDVLGLDKAGVLLIRGLYDVVDESGHAGRLFCTDCERDSEVPNEISWE